MASQESSRYHIPHPPPPRSEEDERDSSPQDTLLPRSSLERYKNNTWSVTIDPILFLRGSSLVFSLVTFFIFVFDGGAAFIATDIFLAFLMIRNVASLLQYTVSHLVKVTVEVRQTSFALGNQKNTQLKPRISIVLDLVLAFAVALSLIIGNAVKDRWDGSGAWHVAVVFGYLVVLLQVLVVVPVVGGKSLTVTFRLNDRQGKDVPDTKLPFHEASPSGGADVGAARRRTAEAEEPRQTAEDLV